MPITVPPFSQYQAPMYPLRALWNSAPPEGDRFISCEIDWGVTTPLNQPAVQVALSGNSPLAFSQIVALAVDNARCGSDVQFIFTDSGFVLVVPAYTQGIYPVFTNALMFYVVCSNAANDDATTFQVLNSMPPPLQITPSNEQQQAAATGLNLGVNGTVQIIPASVTGGTIEGFSFTFSGNVSAPEACELTLQDGLGNILWQGEISLAPNNQTFTMNISGLHKRFFNGVVAVISGSTIPSGAGGGSINIYYGVP